MLLLTEELTLEEAADVLLDEIDAIDDVNELLDTASAEETDELLDTASEDAKDELLDTASADETDEPLSATEDDTDDLAPEEEPPPPQADNRITEAKTNEFTFIIERMSMNLAVI